MIQNAIKGVEEMLLKLGKVLHGMQKDQKKKKGEEGFTLIELLVVVIIIGILAAIAIPVFLSQRAGAQNAGAESDLRNAAAAATSCYAANDGSYLGAVTADKCTKAKLISDYGFNETSGVTVTVNDAAMTADKWTGSAAHSNTSTVTFTYDSDNGTVVEVP